MVTIDGEQKSKELIHQKWTSAGSRMHENANGVMVTWFGIITLIRWHCHTYHALLINSIPLRKKGPWLMSIVIQTIYVQTEAVSWEQKVSYLFLVMSQKASKKHLASMSSIVTKSNLAKLWPPSSMFYAIYLAPTAIIPKKLIVRLVNNL